MAHVQHPDQAGADFMAIQSKVTARAMRDDKLPHRTPRAPAYAGMYRQNLDRGPDLIERRICR